MAISLDCELTFEASLLLLHYLHSDQVLEIRIVRRKSIADVLIGLRDPCRHNSMVVLLVVEVSAADPVDIFFLLSAHIITENYSRHSWRLLRRTITWLSHLSRHFDIFNY